MFLQHLPNFSGIFMAQYFGPLPPNDTYIQIYFYIAKSASGGSLPTAIAAETRCFHSSCAPSSDAAAGLRRRGRRCGRVPGVEDRLLLSLLEAEGRAGWKQSRILLSVL